MNAGSSWVIPLCRLFQLIPTFPASSVMSTSDHTASADGGSRHAHSRPLHVRRQIAGNAQVKSGRRSVLSPHGRGRLGEGVEVT